jgi:hypothetical protein
MSELNEIKSVMFQLGKAVTEEVQADERRIIECFLAPLVGAKSVSIGKR